MAKDEKVRLEYHLKLNGRNPRHVNAARALASVDKQYKSSFIALAIEYYMSAHPMGISLEELLDIYRQSDRTYQPKAPIADNLQNAQGARDRPPAEAPPVRKTDIREDKETSSAIDKAMDLYDIS